MARNTANSIMVLKPLTRRVDVAVLVNGVDRTDFTKIKKDYKKWLTNKRKHGIMISRKRGNEMKRITFNFELDWENVAHTVTIEVEDDATEEEINYTIEEEILSNVHYWIEENK